MIMEEISVTYEEAAKLLNTHEASEKQLTHIIVNSKQYLVTNDDKHGL
jgi:hypothetical protein